MAKSSYEKKLEDPAWAVKRAKILDRDDYTCQSCGDREGVLQVHHKHYINGREPWEYPDDVLITLCKTCHEIEESGRKNAFVNLNKAIAEAGFTREDVQKLTTAFQDIHVKPIYSYIVTSKIYAAITRSWQDFVSDHKDENPSKYPLTEYFQKYINEIENY